jgi:hypothetical protein
LSEPVSSSVKAFVKFEHKESNQVYENPALSSYYELGLSAYFNEMERRIHMVYERLKRNIKPWEWDWENYSGDNADMVGFFYPEDIEAVEQLKRFEEERESKGKK